MRKKCACLAKASVENSKYNRKLLMPALTLDRLLLVYSNTLHAERVNTLHAEEGL